MEITNRWLKKHRACNEGVDWIKTEKNRDELRIVKKLIRLNHFDWANWYISRRLNKIRKVRYAIYAAEQVIKIYENKHPDDTRPRDAINAAKKYVKNPCKKNKTAADTAAHAAIFAAYYAADASNSAIFAAAHAAAHAADSAYYAAAHAATYADSAYYAAAHAADSAAAIKKRIIQYRIKLIQKMT